MGDSEDPLRRGTFFPPPCPFPPTPAIKSGREPTLPAAMVRAPLISVPRHESMWSFMKKLFFLRCVTLSLALLFALALNADLSAADAPSGEQIYKAQCARCHGPQGEGSKHYKQRLEGDRSVAQLADVIRK